MKHIIILLFALSFSLSNINTHAQDTMSVRMLNNTPDRYALLQISPYGTILPMTLVNKDFGSIGLVGIGANAEYHLPRIATIRGDFNYSLAVVNDLNTYKSENKSQKTFFIGGTYHLIERTKKKDIKASWTEETWRMGNTHGYETTTIRPQMNVTRILGPRVTYCHQGFGEGSLSYVGIGFDLTSLVVGDLQVPSMNDTRHYDETKTLYVEALFATAKVTSPGLPFNGKDAKGATQSTKGFQLGFRSTSWFNNNLYIDLAVGYPVLFSGKMGMTLNYKKR